MKNNFIALSEDGETYYVDVSKILYVKELSETVTIRFENLDLYITLRTSNAAPLLRILGKKKRNNENHIKQNS